MKRQFQSLQYKTKANDVDEEKGIVTVAVNGIGVKDSQNDISMPGSFNKTLRENINRMKWFLNHDTTQLLGVPLSGKEDGGNLVMVGQLNLEKQIGRDILSDYKLYASTGRTLEHSIGVQAIKRDEADPRKVLEWKMFEYSTLTSWGSNPQTFLVDIKSATPDKVREMFDFLHEALTAKYGHTDEKLKEYEMNLEMLKKAFGETPNMVTCPNCGHEFDYDAQKEHTFSEQVLEMAAMYARWIADDAVEQHMNELAPEIQNEVLSVIGAVKMQGIDTKNQELIQKSITDTMAYVRCPKCWNRVYKTIANLEKADDTTKADEPLNGTHEDVLEKKDDVQSEEKAATSTFFESLNDCFN